MRAACWNVEVTCMYSCGVEFDNRRDVGCLCLLLINTHRCIVEL